VIEECDKTRLAEAHGTMTLKVRQQCTILYNQPATTHTITQDCKCLQILTYCSLNGLANGKFQPTIQRRYAM